VRLLEKERREIIHIPLVFSFFCFEKWAELGGLRPGMGGGQRRMMGEVVGPLENEGQRSKLCSLEKLHSPSY
jgi:hypothetical protein